MRFACCLFLLVGWGAVAAAQVPTTTPLVPSSQAIEAPLPALAPPEALTLPKKKVPRRAIAISVLGSLGGLAVGTAGIGISGVALNNGVEAASLAVGLTAFGATALVGPGLGHLYAKDTRHFIGFSLLRGGALALAGVAGLIASNRSSVDCPVDVCPSGGGGAELLAYTAIFTYGGLALYDLFAGARAVRRLNGDFTPSTSTPDPDPEPVYEPEYEPVGVPQ